MRQLSIKRKSWRSISLKPCLIKLWQKSSWKTIKQILRNKGIVWRNKFSLFGGKKRVNIEYKVEQMLNVSCINVIGKFLGTKPTSVSDQKNTDLSKALNIIVEKYSTHLVIKEIKENVKHFNPFSFQKVSNSNVCKLLRNIKLVCFWSNSTEILKDCGRLSSWPTCFYHQFCYYSKYLSKQSQRSFSYASW